ncbi:hypothetical protein [Ohtaekwangia sp.]|uniref:hypothetical protein n=1 Tax=Ohtaekwangia sp. TaxID=2066019 RepID=UPI002F9264AB
MPNQKFFENQSAQVYYDEALDALFLEYTNKVLSHEQFVAINMAVLNTFTKLKTVKFVADIRKMGVISVESKAWVVNNLLPGMVKHLKGGELIHVQFMDTSEVFSKIAANHVKDKSSEKIEKLRIAQFTDRTEMEAYLRTV